MYAAPTRTLRRIINWIFPGHCLVCKKALAEHVVCPDCYPQLPFQVHSCQRCGQTLAGGADCCGRCLQHPPPFDACYCPFRYAAPIDQLIRDFKYHERPQLAGLAADLMVAELSALNVPTPDLLIPVPLHRSKLRQRGFNQAWELARSLSRRMKIPCSRNIILKHRATPAQATRSMTARQQNVRGSFSLSMPPQVRHIAVIDDVVTTGSTASEIAKILKRNGVDYVQVWGIAHTV